MKIFLVICVYIVAVNAFPEHKTWSEFKLNFNKNYLNIKEEQLRLQIFKNNLKRIEEHNAKYEKGEVSYFFAVNEFADMTSQEFMTMVNGQLQIQSESELNTTLFDDQNYNVPASVDWRSKADVGVKNQKQCGSCWAFSTTGALEGQLALKRNKKISLSEQQLVDCNKVNHGCRGGDMRQAFKYVQINGIDSEASYKYTAKDGSCKKGTKVLDKLSGYKAVAANENALKTAVGTIGPVSIGVNADNNWQFYGGGIFDHSQCSNKLNHGVLAVGYGNDKKDYWIIKNSWGTDWGEKGYIRLVRGKNQCGVSSYATYPVL